MTKLSSFSRGSEKILSPREQGSKLIGVYIEGLHKLDNPLSSNEFGSIGCNFIIDLGVPGISYRGKPITSPYREFKLCKFLPLDHLLFYFFYFFEATTGLR